jgi:peroxiredoxin/predicted 2-oxoglutarate/Fe(II)-dependent dioxygenase YbiX
MQEPATRPPRPGEPAPWFTLPADCNPAFHFDTVAGRYVVLSFFESAARAGSGAALEAFLAATARFNGVDAAFLGVTVDPADERLAPRFTPLAATRLLFDTDRAVSALYGAASRAADGPGYTRVTYVLDPRLRVLARIPFDDAALEHARRVLDYLDRLPRLGARAAAAVDAHAPVLAVPRVFEPELCRELVAFYEREGGAPSGFMRDVDGRTRLVHDAGHKVRRDQPVTDARLREAMLVRIRTRLVPEIARAFQFHATRIERHIVACYEGETAGHFRAHRDNTTKGTAHRRFAVTLNLNAGEYAGGELCFPEYGRRTYLAPTGGAIVFSCSLLHEALPVTRGRRYAYLPFLYDDAAAAVRSANRQYLDLPAPDPGA